MPPRVIKTAEAAIGILREFGGPNVRCAVERRLYEVTTPGTRYESESWNGHITIGDPVFAEAMVTCASSADELVRRLKEVALADRKARLARAKLGHREKGIEGASTAKLTRAPVLCLEHQP